MANYGMSLKPEMLSNNTSTFHNDIKGMQMPVTSQSMDALNFYSNPVMPSTTMPSNTLGLDTTFASSFDYPITFNGNPGSIAQLDPSTSWANTADSVSYTHLTLPTKRIV